MAEVQWEPRAVDKKAKCNWNLHIGWRCKREKAHKGPCALVPRWWNKPWLRSLR